MPPLPAGWQLVAAAAPSDGSLALLGTDVDLDKAKQRGADGAPLGDPAGAAACATARLWTFDGHALRECVIAPLETPYPLFDRFADGR